MIAFDTDVFSDILRRSRGCDKLFSKIEKSQQAIPIVIAEELIRGHLNYIRRAESDQKLDLTLSYLRFEECLKVVNSIRVLSYSAQAHTLVRDWKVAKFRAGTNDLRIAAIAVTHQATLVTRNRRDYDQIPGLSLEVWP